jgi:hypothetical protein
MILVTFKENYCIENSTMYIKIIMNVLVRHVYLVAVGGKDASYPKHEISGIFLSLFVPRHDVEI